MPWNGTHSQWHGKTKYFATVGYCPDSRSHVHGPIILPMKPVAKLPLTSLGEVSLSQALIFLSWYTARFLIQFINYCAVLTFVCLRNSHTLYRWYFFCLNLIRLQTLFYARWLIWRHQSLCLGGFPLWLTIALLQLQSSVAWKPTTLLLEWAFSML